MASTITKTFLLSKENCPKCNIAKKLLKQYCLKYTEIDESNVLAEGYDTVPVIFFKLSDRSTLVFTSILDAKRFLKDVYRY